MDGKVQFPDGWMIPRHGFRETRHVLKAQTGFELFLILVSKRGTPHVCHELEHCLVRDGLERTGFQGRYVDGCHSRSSALKCLLWSSRWEWENETGEGFMRQERTNHLKKEVITPMGTGRDWRERMIGGTARYQRREGLAAHGCDDDKCVMSALHKHACSYC